VTKTIGSIALGALGLWILFSMLGDSSASGDNSAPGLPQSTSEDTTDDSTKPGSTGESEERAMTVLYTIHNAGYVEPCG